MAKPKLKWNRENVRDMLEKSDKALIRGLLRIHSFQTAEEQQAGVTREDNGMGFNGTDAEFLTSLVVFHKEAGFLTPGQIAICRKKMLKYAGQLARIANTDETLRANGREPHND